MSSKDTARQAIKGVFEDDSLTQRGALDALEDLRDDLNSMIDALKDDIRADRDDEREDAEV